MPSWRRSLAFGSARKVTVSPFNALCGRKDQTQQGDAEEFWKNGISFWLSVVMQPPFSPEGYQQQAMENGLISETLAGCEMTRPAMILFSVYAGHHTNQ